MCLKERESHWRRKEAVTASRTGSYPRFFGSERRLEAIDSMIQVYVIKSVSATIYTINTQGGRFGFLVKEWTFPSGVQDRKFGSLI